MLHSIANSLKSITVVFFKPLINRVFLSMSGKVYFKLNIVIFNKIYSVQELTWKNLNKIQQKTLADEFEKIMRK